MVNLQQQSLLFVKTPFRAQPAQGGNSIELPRGVGIILLALNPNIAEFCMVSAVLEKAHLQYPCAPSYHADRRLFEASVADELHDPPDPSRHTGNESGAYR